MHAQGAPTAFDRSQLLLCATGKLKSVRARHQETHQCEPAACPLPDQRWACAGE
jgi:hypothetical protein